MNVVERSINYLSTIGIADIVDILIVAYIIYRIILLVRKTNSLYLARGMMIFIAALWLSAILNLTMVNYFLKKAVELGLLALVILFQPEIRRALEKIGGKFSRITKETTVEVSDAIGQTVLAATDMSKSKTGALIVFERDNLLTEYISSGTIINADVTSELIKNLFYNKAPLHDGAIIIREDKIVSAGCVLPLTKSTNLSKELGMRHRAGIGLSETSDAVVIIVSEQSGYISLSIDGMLKRHLSPTTLDKLLRSYLVHVNTEKIQNGILEKIKSVISIVNKSEKEENNEKTD